ncbi:hypothetical protein JCM8208_000399 [Rhodotorula glutinis]
MPHALPHTASRSPSLIASRAPSVRSDVARSTREPLRSSKHPPHPLLAPFNLLLAALLIPLSVPTLQLATPTLLVSVLEATLETRIHDAHDDWRGSWDRKHRRALVHVLITAIDQVLHGLARRLRINDDGTVGEAPTWRADEVDVDDVVRGRDDAIARLVAPLLDIARALGVLPEATTDDSPTTLKARERVLPSPPETPTARTRSRARPSSVLPHIERHSPPRSPAPRPDTSPAPSTLFAPRPLRAPRPRPPSAPPLAPAPPSPTRTSRSEPLAAPSTSSSPTSVSTKTPARPSFLAQVAADRWRSPPPPVCPLSPRRRRAHSGPGEGAGAREQDGEGEGGEEGRDSERETRRSTLEVLRRTLGDVQARAARLREAEVEDRGVEEERAAVEVDEQRESAREEEVEEVEARTPSRRRRVRPLAETSTSPSTARPSSASASTSSSSASTSSLDDTFNASTRTPRRKAPSLPPCTCARPSPLHRPVRSPLMGSPGTAPRPGASSTTSTTGTKPRRVRLARARARERPIGADEQREASPSGAELSLHSSTDVEAFERAHRAPRGSAPLVAAIVADNPPPAAPSCAPPLADADTAERTSPYTLLLLAHRARLREKLALLERRERDRREAARGGGESGRGSK